MNQPASSVQRCQQKFLGRGLPFRGERDSLFFWEIFAGCAKFSLCMQCQNFQVLPVDHDGSEHQPLTPVLFADLRELPVQQMLLQRLKTNPSCCIHFAMPGLGPFHAAKVASANRLLEFVVQLLVECWLNNIHVILENPERSWIWAAITVTALVLKHSSSLFHRWLQQFVGRCFRCM